MEFHDKLQALRKQKGITQEELAEALYVSRTAVSKWESGRGYPNIDSLKALSAYFGVTIDHLLSGEELLTLAQEDRKARAGQMQDVSFGLLDVSMVLLYVLPFFGSRAGDAVQSVPLFLLRNAPGYLVWGYALWAGLMALLGIAALALQRIHVPRWEKAKRPLSLLLGAAGMLLFVLSRQPYAAVFVFAVLCAKAFLYFKKG